MRLAHRAAVLLSLLVLFTTLASAWSKEDHEIFRIRDEFSKHEGDNVTFYTYLGIKPGASQKEVDTAYKKLSRTLHPDKAYSTWLSERNKAGAKAKQPSKTEKTKFEKEASARFERLSLVVNILRGPERARYDHFLSNGFPKWRGTGYYYQRFRPGLGSVLVGLFVVFGGGAHYIVLYLNWKRQREFVERYIKHARRTAWGDDSSINSIPGLNGSTSNSGTPKGSDSEEAGRSMQWNRKQKRAMERDKKKGPGKAPAGNGRLAAKAKEEGISEPVEAEKMIVDGPVGAKKRTMAENGKVLIVDSVGNVFLEDETEEGERREFLLDPNEVPAPGIQNTFLVRGPLALYSMTAARVFGRRTPEQIAQEAMDGDEAEPQSETDAMLQAATQVNGNAEARKRRSKARS
ncbi:hypothetical protein LTR97_012662 [Elasticomyces elasticus]|uniref:J domain-containing protein n=1 Tax=Elasticomyces elasticus TaxID=574655 RepID=A0AAN7VKS7_9PEZI|nr:hypothetical protein LTR97_012662 [Elasticomyces elasticus]